MFVFNSTRSRLVDPVVKRVISPAARIANPIQSKVRHYSQRRVVSVTPERTLCHSCAYKLRKQSSTWRRNNEPFPTVTRQVRRSSTTPSEQYEAVVVGAGPAGITAMGNLLENGVKPILWIDKAFNGGRINQYYREVPSNTKVKLFIDFATATAPFRDVANDTSTHAKEPSTNEHAQVAKHDKSDKLQPLRMLDADKGCQLSYAADMSLMLTQGLMKYPGVTGHVGTVDEAFLNEDSPLSAWTIHVKNQTQGSDASEAHTKRLILCTGATPTDPPLPVEIPGLEHLHLDDALSPTKLSEIMMKRGPTTVAVIGASHSSVLILRNLVDLSLQHKNDLKVKWFTRHPIRYAEYEEGFIALDNTGLKGEAAVWARENLEPETMPHKPTGRVITKVAYEKGKEKQVYVEHLPGCDFVVQAIGFQANPIPILKARDGKHITPQFDHDKGWFNFVRNGEQMRLPGLYGAGIAFPERVIDRKYGHEEMNVGFFKFMKAVKKWVAHWN